MPQTYAPMRPAAPWRRVVAAAVNLLLALLPALVAPWVIAGRITLAAASLAVMLMMQMIFGAGPGGLILGLRLRRGFGTQRPAPGPVIGRALLVAIASVATVGIFPLIAILRGGPTLWYRVSDTMVMTAPKHPEVFYTLVTDEGSFPLESAVILGRAPKPTADRKNVRALKALIQDQSVSKVHALLVPTTEGVRISDLGSTNGTHVEGAGGLHRLEPGRSEIVVRGAKVYFGDAGCLIW